jgi:ketosteroid isomerase-like protein
MATSSDIPGPSEQTAPSAEVIRRLRAGYDAFARGDIDGLVIQLHPDVELHNPEYAIESGVRHGRNGVKKALEALQELFDYESIELEEIIPVDERVIAVLRIRGTGKGSGVPIDERFAHLWTVRDGLGIRLH